jgi:hypothetical protein
MTLASCELLRKLFDGAIDAAQSAVRRTAVMDSEHPQRFN